MSSLQIEPELMAAVCALAKDAGEAVMAVYNEADGGAAAVVRKGDDSPLTLADLASHRCIVDGLARLTPSIPVVSEEDTASFFHRTPAGVFWLIDPLDGTKEFIARNGEFTVNIALVSDACPVWGVVYAPALDELYWGGAGAGAWKKVAEAAPVRIAVSPPVAATGVTRVVASKSHMNAETLAIIERLGRTELVQAGSSLKFCRIADGQADVYPRIAPTCEWDTAAAQAVVEGAGGVVHDLSGQRLQYGKPEVLNPAFIAASSAFSG